MDFLEALQDRGIEFRKKSTDGEIDICCPFCVDNGETEDTRFRLGVNWKKDFAHCFNCKWKSREALKDIIEKLSLPEYIDRKKVPVKEEVVVPYLPKDFELLYPCPDDKECRKAYLYLRKTRGLTQEQISRHRVGMSSSGLYAYRVIFPIYYGKWLRGFVGRDYTGKQERPYMNMKGMKTIFNCPKKKKNKTAILVEGIFDALAIEREMENEGVDAIALLGLGLTERTQKLLHKYKTIYLWPDSDKPGVEGAIKLAYILSEKHEVKMVVADELDDRDPDELSYAEMEERFKNAKAFSETWATRLRVQLAFA